MRLFLDINVVLDVLTRREPWWQDSAAVLSLLDSGDVTGVMTAHSVTSLHCLCAKHLGRAEATAALLKLLGVVTIAPLDQDLLLRALSVATHDVEDAVRGISAQQARADYLVTRDPAGFPSLSVPVVTPNELLALLSLPDP